METVQTYTKQLRELADKEEKAGLYDLRHVATDTIRCYADLIDNAIARRRNCDRGFKDAKEAERVYWKERHDHMDSIEDLDERCRAIDRYPQFAEWLLQPIS